MLVANHLNMAVMGLEMGPYMTNTIAKSVISRKRGNMANSTNNRVITEQYLKEGLKARISGGIATPGQRDGVKGLRVLMDASLSVNGLPLFIPAGSTVYIKEVVLHTHEWASKPMTCDFISEKFLIVDFQFVEFWDPPSGSVA